jgi:hypothetical protein
MIVVEAAILGGDLPGWWGVMRGGGAPAISGAEVGHREAACVCAHEAVVAALAIWPREEDDRAGLACQQERAGRAGWADQRLRPSGGWWRWPNGRGKGSGPAGLEGEAGRGWAECGAGAEFKKKFFSNFN